LLFILILCSGGFCQCNSGWFGASCNITNCFGKFSNESTACSKRGSCVNPNLCICNSGWKGDECEFFHCLDKNNCSYSSHRGECVGPNTCSCNENYIGESCEESVCFGKNSTDPTVCFGLSFCVVVNIYHIYLSYYILGRGNCSSPNSCDCNSGYTGNQCEFAVCFGKNSSDESVCSHNGICHNLNNCTCNNGYVGNQCQYSVCFGKNSSDDVVCFGL